MGMILSSSTPVAGKECFLEALLRFLTLSTIPDLSHTHLPVLMLLCRLRKNPRNSQLE